MPDPDEIVARVQNAIATSTRRPLLGPGMQQRDYPSRLDIPERTSLNLVSVSTMRQALTGYPNHFLTMDLRASVEFERLKDAIETAQANARFEP